MRKTKGKKAGRYEVSQLVEGQFEPGSRGRVLKNLLGIKLKREMDRVEAKEQLHALDELIKTYGKSHRFTAADIMPNSRNLAEKHLCLGGKIQAGQRDEGQLYVRCRQPDSPTDARS